MKLNVALALFAALPILAAPKEAPVTLQVDTLEKHLLKPSSAFELRFAEPMVAADDVGKPDRPSPLVIRPWSQVKVARLRPSCASHSRPPLP